MDLFRITGLLVDESRSEQPRDFAPRYGWRQATARWLGESVTAAREAVAACCRSESRPSCAEC